MLRGLQAVLAEPGLLLEGGLAAGAYLRRFAGALGAAVPALPLVVLVLAGEVEVVGVYVED